MKIRAVVPSRAGGAAGSADGFTLIEVVVALGLILMVMTATATFFVRGLSETRSMQQRQSGTAFAEQTVEQVRTLNPVQLQAAAAASPSVSASTVGKTNYEATTTVRKCALSAAGSCQPDSTGEMYLVEVVVEWSPCSRGGCRMGVTTIRDSVLPEVTKLIEVPS